MANQTMRRATLAATICGFAFAATAQEVQIPSDPSARYWILDVHAVGDGMVEITTKRTGKSGTSYARRLVDCNNNRFKYIGDSDNLEEMNSQRLDSDWSGLVDGSISYYFSHYACRATSQ